MRYERLVDWLEWQEKLHPVPVDLGLERVRAVADNCQLLPVKPLVITVAGTNGKGSTVAILQSILQAEGYRVGSYTSPHLRYYNERICIDGKPVGDQEICESFDFIDRNRYRTSLSFFEFGTLAALHCFRCHTLDVIILEVGVGGRLDAVNIVDSAVAVISSIGIDHTEWLGGDREAIAYEKAGIMRSGRPIVCGDANPPITIAQVAEKKQAVLYQRNKHFEYLSNESTFAFRFEHDTIDELPYPALFGDVQLENTATVLAVLHCIQDQLPVSKQAIAKGLVQVKLSGRFEIRAGKPIRIFDIAHNPQGTSVLAQNLKKLKCTGTTHAVFAVLADKDVRGILHEVFPVVDYWHLAQVNASRALRLDVLWPIVRESVAEDRITNYISVADACHGALTSMTGDDRLLVFGSMITVGEAFSAGI